MRKSFLSPAKINLGLSIVGRRETGYHNLESLFWPLNFGDTITLSLGDSQVRVQWDKSAPFSKTELPAEQDNIVTKVLNLLPNLESKWIVEISKQIPIGGGLGGGSSNIGTILKFFRENNIVQITDLEPWAAQFGADIPFFLHSRPAWVTGIGENIQALEIEPALTQKLYFLLIVFPFGCETKSIFKEFKIRNSTFTPSTLPFANKRVTESAFLSYLARAKNDLEPIVCDLYPQIGLVLDRLKSLDCLWSGLSGSGATCFALFDSKESREETAKDLQPFFRLNNCRSIFAETFATH